MVKKEIREIISREGNIYGVRKPLNRGKISYLELVRLRHSVSYSKESSGTLEIPP